MSNGLYVKYREEQLGGVAMVSWGTGSGGDTIKALLIDAADYTVNLAIHQYKSDIPGAAIVATSPAFTGKTFTGGVADADNITFATVTGDQSEGLIIFKDTGTAATSKLLAWIDTVTGLPVTPNGGDIVVTWDNGTNKIYAL